MARGRWLGLQCPSPSNDGTSFRRQRLGFPAVVTILSRVDEGAQALGATDHCMVDCFGGRARSGDEDVVIGFGRFEHRRTGFRFHILRPPEPSPRARKSVGEGTLGSGRPGSSERGAPRVERLAAGAGRCLFGGSDRGRRSRACSRPAVRRPLGSSQKQCFGCCGGSDTKLETDCPRGCRHQRGPGCIGAILRNRAEVWNVDKRQEGNGRGDTVRLQVSGVLRGV